MQRLSGNGLAFLEFDGHIKEYELAPGQQLVIDTGYLAAMTGSCQLEIQTVPGIKNVVFGGEGLFNTVVTGPGVCQFLSLQVQSDLLFQQATKPIKQDCRYSGSPVLHFVLNSFVLYFIYAIPFAVLYFHSISA